MEIFLNVETWVAVAFVIFVAAIYRPVKRGLLNALDARIAEVRREVEEAKRLREEAQTLLAQYQRRQREAAKEVESLMARARADAQAHRKAVETGLAAALERQEIQAKERIAQAEANAIQEVRTAAVEVAIAATRRILMEKLDGPAGEAAIDRSIQDLPKRLH